MQSAITKFYKLDVANNKVLSKTSQQKEMDCYNRLKEMLDNNEKEKLEELLEIITDNNDTFSRFAYIKGFKTGLAIGLEMSDKEDICN